MAVLTPPDAPLTDGVVSLRGCRRDDRDAVVAAVQNPAIARWTQVPSPYGAAEYDAWLVQQDEQLRARSGMHFLIVDAEDRLLGSTGVQLTEDTPDIGYWCVAEHRRRGYVTRAVRLLGGHVLALGFARVDIFVHDDNRPSQRVAEAAGFSRQPGLPAAARVAGGARYIRFSMT